MKYVHRMETRLEIRHLRLLTAIAEEGSVTGAVRRLHLTQSALSHQLKDAEDKLGTALFLRLGKRMVPTPAGEKLLISAKRVLEELQGVESQIEGLNGGSKGAIRFSTECYTCYHWLPPLLKKFHSKYPQVEVNIYADATCNPAEFLLKGELDVGILSCLPRNTSLKATPIFEDELVIVMAPNHPLTELTHIRPKDLANETVMIYPPRQESTLIMKVLAPAGIEPKRVLEVPLTEAIIELAAAGTGIGFLARWAIAPHLERKRVAVRPLSAKGFRRSWYAVTIRKQVQPPYLTEFLKLLATHPPKSG